MYFGFVLLRQVLMDPKVSSAGLCRFTLSLDHPASSSPELVLQEGLPRAARTALVSSGLHICQAVTLSTQVYLHLLSSYHPQSCCIALCKSQRPVTSPALVSLVQRGDHHIQSRAFSPDGTTLSVSSANSSSKCSQHSDGFLLYLGRCLGAISKAEHMAPILVPANPHPSLQPALQAVPGCVLKHLYMMRWVIFPPPHPS